MGTRPSGYKYSIFGRDWNVTRQCDIHVDTAFAMATFKDCPVISDRGEYYLMPFRNDTLYHVTADADIPFAVFDKGNYRIPSDGYTYNALKSNMETKIWDTGGSICMISDYLLYCFSYSGRQYAQVWDAGTGRLVFCDMVSAKDGTPGFTLNICGSDFKLWPHFVSGDDVWCTLGYSDAASSSRTFRRMTTLCCFTFATPAARDHPLPCGSVQTALYFVNYRQVIFLEFLRKCPEKNFRENSKQFLNLQQKP